MSTIIVKNKSVVTGATRLDRLSDVDATGETDGAILVYEPSTDTYVVKKLDLSYVTGNVDSGTF